VSPRKRRGRGRTDGDEGQRPKCAAAGRQANGQDASHEEEQRVAQVEPVSQPYGVELLAQQRQHLRRRVVQAVRPLDGVAEHGHGREEAEALHQQNQPGGQQQVAGSGGRVVGRISG
jgi:hypothetical protein